MRVVSRLGALPQPVSIAAVIAAARRRVGRGPVGGAKRTACGGLRGARPTLRVVTLSPLSLNELLVCLYAHQNAESETDCHERRAAVAHERQRYADDRQDAAHHSHVDEGVREERERNRAGKKTREK